MSTDKDSILAALDFDLESSKMTVLKAIFAAQEELGQGTVFEELEERIPEVSGGKSMSRPLIYRYLKTLEESRILIVDRQSKPNQYIVNFESIVQSLNEVKRKKIEDIRDSLQKFSNQHEGLLTVQQENMSWLARRMFVKLVGKTERVGAKTAKGLKDAQTLLDTEIYSRAVEGDTIRITTDWFEMPQMQEIERHAGGLKLVVRGVNLKTLQYFPERVPKEIVKLRYDRLKDLKGKGFETNYRIAKRHVHTYQGVGFNREGFGLIVSEEPLTMVWVPRTSNAALVDEATDNFDQDFEEGIDYLEYYRKVFEGNDE